MSGGCRRAHHRLHHLQGREGAGRAARHHLLQAERVRRALPELYEPARGMPGL